MTEFLPTYLYIKTHNQTGLKYFGKTTKDPFKYNRLWEILGKTLKDPSE